MCIVYSSRKVDSRVQVREKWLSVGNLILPIQIHTDFYPQLFHVISHTHYFLLRGTILELKAVCERNTAPMYCVICELLTS